MYTVEFHDSDTENINLGTLLSCVGADNEVEAEQHIREMLGDEEASRAYLLRNGWPVATWRLGATATIEYVGCTMSYRSGADKILTPHRYYSGMTLEPLLAREEDRATAFRNGQEWSRDVIHGHRKPAAVVFDQKGIVAAWEGNSETSQLVARGPLVG